MDKKHTEKLLKDFPTLYSGYYKSMQETCMCWGFACGSGWYNLIYNLSQDIMIYKPETIATQVKEKFGGLRFYTEGYDSIIQKLISHAEDESYKICEYCGSKNEVSQTKGWISTLCKECMSSNGKNTRNIEETFEEVNRVHKQSGQKPVRDIV